MNVRAWLAPTITAAVAHGALVALPVAFDHDAELASAPQVIQVRLAPAKVEAPQPAPKTIESKPVVEASVPAPVPPEPQAAPEPQPQPTQVASLPDEHRQVEATTKPKLDLRSYGELVFQSINRHKSYPVAARKMKLTGKVYVQVAIGKDGLLAEAPKVYRSSGHDLLDRRALEMVRKAGPFPPLPRGFNKDRAAMVIPVDFSLEQG